MDDEQLLVTPTFSKEYFGKPGTEIFKDKAPFPQCKCGFAKCSHGKGEGNPLWVVSTKSEYGGEQIFTGCLKLYSGEVKKLDNPIELLDESKNTSNLSGHLMTLWEYASEMDHLCSITNNFLEEFCRARDIGKYLADYRFISMLMSLQKDLKRKGGEAQDELEEKDDMMYPFYEKLEPPFSRNPAPKVHASDIVEVVTTVCLKYGDDFTIPCNSEMQVYVISVTSSGIVTGFFQTKKDERYWVYFPIHCVRRIVTRFRA